MHYSDNQLEQLMQADEGDLLLKAQSLDHLEQCIKCQDRLSELSGDETWLHRLADEDASISDQLLGDDLSDEFHLDVDRFSGGNAFGLASASITVSIGPSGDWEGAIRLMRLFPMD